MNTSEDNSQTDSNKPGGVISEQDSPILHNTENNQNLPFNTLSLGHLRIYLNMKFLSLKRAGQRAGLSYSRVKQLVTGKFLPSKPELIKQLSEAWDIDPIKLTQLFERMREKNDD